MEVQEFTNNIIEIQRNLLEYIDSKDNNENDDKNIIQILNNSNIQENKDEFLIIIHFIAQISNNHHRGPIFFRNIFKILQYFKESIKRYLSNEEIFNIFKKNKKILLLLSISKIFKIDQTIATRMTSTKFINAKYPQYFFPEIKKFIGKDQVEQYSKEMEDDFDERRKIGQNDAYICKLMREDNIDDFIIYVNRTNYPIKTARITPSVFETNLFLQKRNPTLIEYAAFFESVKIFQYLFMNGVDLHPSLWLYVIRGSNPELIHFLEDNHVIPPQNSFFICLKEALKCHNNEIVDYFQNNIIQNFTVYSKQFLVLALKYYNIASIDFGLINLQHFYNLFNWDYFWLIKILILYGNININGIMITF